MPGESFLKQNLSAFIDVSIHSRQLCRENQSETAETMPLYPSFNPLPAIMPGESESHEAW